MVGEGGVASSRVTLPEETTRMHGRPGCDGRLRFRRERKKRASDAPHLYVRPAASPRCFHSENSCWKLPLSIHRERMPAFTSSFA